MKGMSEGGKEMKKQIALMILVALVGTSIAVGQGEPAQPATTQKSLAATLNVYVFPTKGQASQQQSQDEASCYSWAVTNVGFDPFDVQKKAEQQQQQTEQKEGQIEDAGKGAGAKGAVGGAAAGALIGAIAGNSVGHSAAIGAASGLIIARRRAHHQQAQASRQLEQQSQQAAKATQEQMENFKKAFSVCLEGMDYLVKY
jgi:hypothetical protein